MKGQGRKDPLRTLEDCVGRDGNFKSEQVKNSCVPRVGDGNPHGSYFWHQASRVLYVKVSKKFLDENSSIRPLRREKNAVKILTEISTIFPTSSPARASPSRSGRSRSWRSALSWT